MTSVKPDAIGAGKGDSGGSSSTQSRRQFGEIVHRGIGRGADYLIFVQGLQAQTFAARYVALGRRAVHLIPFMVGDDIDANTGTFGELYGTSGLCDRIA